MRTTKNPDQIKNKPLYAVWLKVLLGFSLFISMLCVSPAQARITDLTQIRCSDLFPHGLQQATERDQRHFALLVFWLAGFESGFNGTTQVDIKRIQDLSDIVLAECSKDPEQYCLDLLGR